MRWLSRSKVSKISLVDLFFGKEKQKKPSFFKRFLLNFLKHEIDIIVSLKIKGLTNQVNAFMAPMNKLTNSLNDCKGLIVYRDGGTFQGFILSDMAIRAIVKNNPNIQKIMSSNNLKDIFDKSETTDMDIASEMMKQTKLVVGDGVPDDVAEVFSDVLGGKYD